MEPKVCPLRIEEKLDNLNHKLTAIEVLQAKHNVLLDEHIRRTNLLEERMDRELELNERRWEKLAESIDARMEPVNAHIHNIRGFAKTVGVAGVIVGILAAIAQIFGR